jgi:hypothetical protein
MKLLRNLLLAAIGGLLFAGCYTQFGAMYDDRVRYAEDEQNYDQQADTLASADDADAYYQDRDRLYYDYYNGSYGNDQYGYGSYGYDPYYYQPWYRPWIAFGMYDAYLWGGSYHGGHGYSSWYHHNSPWYGGANGYRGNRWYGQSRSFGNTRNPARMRATSTPTTYTPAGTSTFSLPSGARHVGSSRTPSTTQIPPSTGIRSGAVRGGVVDHPQGTRVWTGARGSAQSAPPSSTHNGGTINTSPRRGSETTRSMPPPTHSAPPPPPPSTSNSGGGSRGSESHSGGSSGGSRSGNRR